MSSWERQPDPDYPGSLLHNGYVSLQQLELHTYPPSEDDESWISYFSNSEPPNLQTQVQNHHGSYQLSSSVSDLTASPVDNSPFCTKFFQIIVLLTEVNIVNAPTRWTVAEASSRAFEIFHNPNFLLSDTSLPPEAALIYMPERPLYPVLRDIDGNGVRSDRFPKTLLRDIPWLPRYFDLQTPAWKVNLYMIFGATVKDMAARAHPQEEPGKTQQQLENRILKKSLDYRNKHGGFGHDIRPLKGVKVTGNARSLILGNKSSGRQALTAYQILFVIKSGPLRWIARLTSSAGRHLECLSRNPTDVTVT
jgi:hypothetical protein